uniref:sugar transferase n=1 Tax=Ndongobacter massiliensis TaxID=1871025 RepID=UPI00093169E4|nr:sugar transferase [Ndongobacter massiliensis]
MLRKWDNLPAELKTDAVRPYYEILTKKKGSLIAKRIFDIIVSFLLLLLLSPLFLVLAIAIKFDSPGPVFFRQVRVTQYGRTFRIFKFRTMVQNAEQLGAKVTGHQDARITKIGQKLRRYRLDEIPQLLDVFRGTMSFVGTRPETPNYVAQYTDEMRATLLLPAGVTSLASIRFKDEADLLAGVADIDTAYVQEVLPRKMAYNLQSLREYSFWGDCKLMLQTVAAVWRK